MINIFLNAVSNFFYLNFEYIAFIEECLIFLGDERVYDFYVIGVGLMIKKIDKFLLW